MAVLREKIYVFIFIYNIYIYTKSGIMYIYPYICVYIYIHKDKWNKEWETNIICKQNKQINKNKAFPLNKKKIIYLIYREK